MTNNLMFLLALALLTTLASDTGVAGAWVQPKDDMYSQVSVTSSLSDKEYQIDGSKHTRFDEGVYKSQSISYYQEYGSTENLTVVASLPFISKSISGSNTFESQTTRGISDFFVGGKYLLYQKKVVVSLQGGTMLPLFYEATDFPSLGDGRMKFEGKVLFGSGFSIGIPAYVGLEVGYTAKAGIESSRLNGLFEIGIQATKELGIQAKYLNSREGEKADLLYYRLSNLLVSTNYSVGSQWWVKLEKSETLFGNNSGADTSYTIGVVRKISGKAEVSAESSAIESE